MGYRGLFCPKKFSISTRLTHKKRNSIVGSKGLSTLAGFGAEHHKTLRLLKLAVQTWREGLKVVQQAQSQSVACR